MEELFHPGSEGRDLFFSSFGNDIGSQLDQLKFEYEAMENGTFEDPEESKENKLTPISLENKINKQLEQNHTTTNGSIELQKDDDKKTRTYSMSIQRAFSTVSLMTSFKSNFWKHRRGKQNKTEDKVAENGNGEVANGGRRRLASTSSDNNNGIPAIKVNGESEGRATIYSTIARPKGNKVARSHTMSPSAKRPWDKTTEELEQLERSESGNIYTPPVVVDGQLVYDYQYATPADGSPAHKSPNKGAKFGRRNSISRLLRLRKSPKKPPKAPNTPLKALYQKTVLSQSEPNAINNVGKNGRKASAETTEQTIPENIEVAT